MFNQNKYTRIYYQIVNNGKNRTLDSAVYVERHHIIPESLGGSNSKDNLVKLTAREHFICHMLLTKMTKGADYKKMIHAFWSMCNYSSGNQQRTYKINSTIYESLKKERSKLLSKPMPEHVKAKISKTTKGGSKKPFSEEHRKNLSESLKGRMPWNKGLQGAYKSSEESRQKISVAVKGRKKSESHKKQISEFRKNKVSCFDKENMKNVFITREEFHSSDRYIGFCNKEYQQYYKGLMNG